MMVKVKLILIILSKQILKKSQEIQIQRLLESSCKIIRKQLHKLEKQAIEEVDLDQAEQISLQIKEFREKEILLKNFVKIEENQREFENLKQMNEEQIHDFNQKWEGIINELQDYSQKIEQAMLEQHEDEKNELENDLRGNEVPKVKYSSQLLNDKFKLKQLIKIRDYVKAKELKDLVCQRQQQEDEEWISKQSEQLDKRRDQLHSKQKNEYDALKSRLQKTIDSNLKQRIEDYEKLLQRIQNSQNELIVKQNLEFSKIQAANAKLLAKYQLNLNNIKMELPQYNNPYKQSFLRSQYTTEQSNNFKNSTPSLNMIDQSRQNNNHVNKSKFSTEQPRFTQETKNSKFDITFLKQKLHANHMEISQSDTSESQSVVSEDEGVFQFNKVMKEKYQIK